MNQYMVGLKLRISGIADIQTGWMMRSSSPEGGKEMYLFPQSSGTFLFTGYRGSFPEPKRRRCKFYLSYPSIAEVKNESSYTHVAPVRLFGLNRKHFITINAATSCERFERNEAAFCVNVFLFVVFSRDTAYF